MVVRINRARFGSGGPTREKALAFLNGLPLKQVDELWACMGMYWEGSAWFESHQLHGLPIGCAQVLNMDSLGKGRLAPRDQVRIEEAISTQ